MTTRSALAVLLLSAASGAGHAALTDILQTDVDLNRNGTKESSLKSFADVAAVCAPCTISSVFVNELDSAQKVYWETLGLASRKRTLLEGEARAAQPISSHWTTFRHVAPRKVAVAASSFNVSFPTVDLLTVADYYEWPMSAIEGATQVYGELKDVYDRLPVGSGRKLRSKIIDSLFSLEFESGYEKLEDGTFRYTLSVASTSNSPIVFDWENAGFAGTVEGNDSSIRTFVSEGLPGEDFSQARATIGGSEFTVPAMYWLPVAAPVPEPSIWMSLGAGLGVLALAARRRRMTREKCSGPA